MCTCLPDYLFTHNQRQKMSIKTFGTMGVDWEERVNFERLQAGG